MEVGDASSRRGAGARAGGAGRPAAGPPGAARAHAARGHALRAPARRAAAGASGSSSARRSRTPSASAWRCRCACCALPAPACGLRLASSASGRPPASRARCSTQAARRPRAPRAAGGASRRCARVAGAGRGAARRLRGSRTRASPSGGWCSTPIPRVSGPRRALNRPRPARVRCGRGAPVEVDGEADRVAARVLAGGGPLVDRRAAAPPLLGARGRARAQRRRLPRPLRRRLVPPGRLVASWMPSVDRLPTPSSTATRPTRSSTAPRCPRSSPQRAGELGYTRARADRPQLRLRLDGAGPGRRRATGVRAIHGAEIDSRRPAPPSRRDPRHLTLLVRDERGWSNLCRILTLAHAHTREGSRRRELGEPAVDAAGGARPRRGARLPDRLRSALGVAAARLGRARVARGCSTRFGPRGPPRRAAAPVTRATTARATARWPRSPGAWGCAAWPPATSTRTRAAAPSCRTPSWRCATTPRSTPPSRCAAATTAT